MIFNLKSKMIIKIFLPFSTNRQIFNTSRYRDAALMAFGAILEGPSSEGLQPIVVEAMPLLIMLMKDEFVAVKDTAAWTIGRVCELNSEAALKEEYLQVFFSVLKKINRAIRYPHRQFKNSLDKILIKCQISKTAKDEFVEPIFVQLLNIKKS